MDFKTYVLGFCAVWTEGAATLLCNGEVVAHFKESDFPNVETETYIPTNSIKACLREKNLKLEQVALVVFYQNPLTKFENAMRNILLQAPFSFLHFLDSSTEWVTDGKIFLKNKIKSELINFSNSPNIPELIFGNSILARRLYYDLDFRHDYGAALLGWHSYLKAPFSSNWENVPQELKKSSLICIEKKFFSIHPMPIKKLSTKELRSFGIVTGILIFAIFWIIFPLWKGMSQSQWSLLSSILFVILGILAPLLLNKPYNVWMFFAQIIGKIKGLIFYSFLYYFLICPYGIVLKMIFSKHLKISNDEASLIKDFDMKGPF